MKTSISDNDTYPAICKLAAETDYHFNNFKQNPGYTAILEHVSVEEGAEYYNHIQAVPAVVNVLSKLEANDRYGNPKKHKYSFGEFSPTTLRYGRVLAHLSQLDLNNKVIVEIGCGYGGQYTVLRQLFTPKRYIFVDLEEALMLTKKYVNTLNLNDIPLEYYSLQNLPVIKSDLVISNYAYSECIQDIQDQYNHTIIDNAKNGYMIYNNFCGYKHDEFIAKIKHKVRILEEVPNTHPNNKLLVW